MFVRTRIGLCSDFPHCYLPRRLAKIDINGLIRGVLLQVEFLVALDTVTIGLVAQ